jgi:hypothetical protein
VDQELADPIERLDGGGRVVDRRRQGADRDVDHQPDREEWVLIDRALVGQGHLLLQVARLDVTSGEHAKQGAVALNVASDPGNQLDGRVEPFGNGA